MQFLFKLQTKDFWRKEGDSRRVRKTDIRKRDVREEKISDVDPCKRSNRKSGVFAFDLEAVLQTPCSRVSVLYYKRKLFWYNFTVFDLVATEAIFFFWHERIEKEEPMKFQVDFWNF